MGRPRDLVVNLVDDFTRNMVDFENSSGFDPAGGIGKGAFSDPTFDQPEDMVERALAKLFLDMLELYELIFPDYPFSETSIVEANSWGWGQAPPGFIFITQEGGVDGMPFGVIFVHRGKGVEPDMQGHAGGLDALRVELIDGPFSNHIRHILELLGRHSGE